MKIKENNKKILNKIKQNKAITLVALVITIIVLIILAGVSINLVLGNNGIITKTQEAKAETEKAQLKEKLEFEILNIQIKKIELGKEMKREDLKELEKIGAIIQSYEIPTEGKYKDYYFEIDENCEVSIIGKVKEEKPNITEEVIWTNNTNTNRTIDGQTATYQNPIIPVGFSAINTADAKWNKTIGSSSEWNNGLVIKNATDGNEFVWVPVDGTNVPYARWCTAGYSYTQCKDLPSTSGVNIVDNVAKYGGFYVARYEAGLDSTINQTIANSDTRNVSGVPLSKAGAVPWNHIDWNHSKANSEKMYSNDYIQSGLINGTQWDTIMKWIENEGKNVSTNSSTWGNYLNSSITLKNEKYNYISIDSGANWAKTTNTTKSTTQLIKTGASDDTKAKNIYDLAGNVWEWTCEEYSSEGVHRSGGCNKDGTLYCASYRINGRISNYTHPYIGFRTQLYVK